MNFQEHRANTDKLAMWCMLPFAILGACMVLGTIGFYGYALLMGVLSWF